MLLRVCWSLKLALRAFSGLEPPRVVKLREELEASFAADSGPMTCSFPTRGFQILGVDLLLDLEAGVDLIHLVP